MLVVRVEVGSDVEDHLLYGPREHERRFVRVSSVDDEPVVATDVHAGIATESERNRVLDSTAAHALAVDEEGDLTRRRGLRCIRGEDKFDVHVPYGQRLVGLLVILEDAEERVCVLE